MEGIKARTIKTASELNNRRTIEKLEIERRYWLAQGIEWKIVTEREIAYKKAKNIEWLYTAYGGDDEIWGQSEAQDMIQMIHSGEYSIVYAPCRYRDDRKYIYPNNSAAQANIRGRSK